MTDPIERLKTALAGRYAVEHELGADGMATVYPGEEASPQSGGEGVTAVPALRRSAGVVWIDNLKTGVVTHADATAVLNRREGDVLRIRPLAFRLVRAST